MSAHRCFTAWNWPIGRPNWTAVAWRSAAVVVTHHDAAPDGLGGQQQGGQALGGAGARRTARPR